MGVICFLAFLLVFHAIFLDKNKAGKLSGVITDDDMCIHL